MTYDVATGQLSLNTTQLSRINTDGGTWSAVLPEKLAPQQTLKLHLFLDGSIVDIFINDRWAFSTRIFSTDAEQVEAEVFTTANIQGTVKAWMLDAKQDVDGRGEIYHERTKNGIRNNTAYDLSGKKFNCQLSTVNSQLKKGIYIINGKKYVTH